MKKYTVLKYIFLGLTILVNLFILVNGFIDGIHSAQTAGSVSHIIETGINTISPGTITDLNRDEFRFLIRKIIGHFCLFGLSGIITTITYILFLNNHKLKTALFSLLFSSVTGFIVSLISELAQLAAEGRYFSMKDVWIDFLGYFLGIIIVFVVYGIAKLIAKDSVKTRS